MAQGHACRRSGRTLKEEFKEVPTLVQTAGEGTPEEEAAAGAEVLRGNKLWCVWGLGLGWGEARLER